MSGLEEEVIGKALKELTRDGLLIQANADSYRMPNRIGRAVIAGESRTTETRATAIDRLRQNASDAELLLELLVDAERTQEAVMTYWDAIGNFARLAGKGRTHFGAALCQRLNGGLGSHEISEVLSRTEGAWAVLNDWSQYAVSFGDASVSASAAESAYRLVPQEPQWNPAQLAGHVAKALLLIGDLRGAIEWYERSWEHARNAMRQTGGFAIREIMDAYDWAAVTMAQVYLRLQLPAEIRRLMDDLMAIHVHARESIVEFNQSSIIPLEGPRGAVSPEDPAEGRVAAMLALAEGRLEDVRALAGRKVGPVAASQLRMLLVRTEILEGQAGQARALLERARLEAEEADDCAQECEVAVLALRVTSDAKSRLAMANSYLPRAAACGLGLYWRDLQIERSRALAELGQFEAARKSGEETLAGIVGLRGAQADWDWVAADEAARLMQEARGIVPEDLLADLQSRPIPRRDSPPRSVPRRAAAYIGSGNAARENYHAAALRVAEAYKAEGMPFVLYLRKFDIEVLHGPFEHGPKLTENWLRDALPQEVEVLTIQDPDSMTYELGSSRMRREAPAFPLDNANWTEAAESLITFADLIVSEPLMLSDGVRLELEMIYRLQRWDRTVLVLPPLESEFSLIDNDELIQMFPRCVWADAMHDTPITEAPVIVDLMERVRALAALRAEKRRNLIDRDARDAAYPIDLLPVAARLEMDAEIGSAFHGDDKSTRYYGFWQMFRASGIRGVQYMKGNRSAENRTKLAKLYLEMSNIMLDHSPEGDKFILQGDPEEAKQLVESAYGILGEDHDVLATHYRERAQDQWNELLRLEHVMRLNRGRFEIRPRYGPLRKRRTRELAE